MMFCPASVVTSVGLFLSWNVRVPSWPHELLPQLYTLVSVTATVCAPPAAMVLTPCSSKRILACNQ